MSPAEVAVDCFGGVRPAARALGVEASTVCRWLKPKQRGGTGGRVPQEHWERALAAAARLGKRLTVMHLAVGKPGIERRVVRRLW